MSMESKPFIALTTETSFSLTNISNCLSKVILVASMHVHLDIAILSVSPRRFEQRTCFRDRNKPRHRPTPPQNGIARTVVNLLQHLPQMFAKPIRVNVFDR